jgi:hypothetical protein
MAACRAHCQPFTHPERAYMMKMVNEKSKATAELQRKLDASNRRLREMKERFEVMAGLQAELPVNTPSEHSRRNSGAGASAPAAPIVKMPTLQDVLAGVAQAQQSLVSPRSDGTPPQSVHGQLTGAPRGAKPAMSVAAAARLVSQMKLVTARTRFQRLQERLQAVERARMADHDVAFLAPTNTCPSRRPCRQPLRAIPRCRIPPPTLRRSWRRFLASATRPPRCGPPFPGLPSTINQRLRRTRWCFSRIWRRGRRGGDHHLRPAALSARKAAGGARDAASEAGGRPRR